MKTEDAVESSTTIARCLGSRPPVLTGVVAKKSLDQRMQCNCVILIICTSRRSRCQMLARMRLVLVKFWPFGARCDDNRCECHITSFQLPARGTGSTVVEICAVDEEIVMARLASSVHRRNTKLVRSDHPNGRLGSLLHWIGRQGSVSSLPPPLVRAFVEA